MEETRPFIQWLKEHRNQALFGAVASGIIYEETLWNEYILGWLPDCEE